jgi:hypothetical protein
MTLFGRHDKNIKDITSIYQSYDRYALTTTGCGVNSISVSNIGTIGSTTSPSIYISNATNIILPAILTTFSTNTSTINSIAVNTWSALLPVGPLSPSSFNFSPVPNLNPT